MLILKSAVPENVRRLMNPEDQRTYGPGVHEPDEDHPEPKTDRPEKAEQRQFANDCLRRQLPFSWHATNARSKATPGTPDFWVGINGTSLWIEFKRDYSAHLSDAQKEFARLLGTQKMRLYVVYSAQEAIALVDLFASGDITQK